jgi:hypothetical protein
MTVRRLAAPAVAEKERDSLQFRAIFAMSFFVFLLIALVSRLTPAYWRSEAPHRSILADACMGAGTTAQMAFAG